MARPPMGHRALFRAEIATKQAKFTLEQLHAELGGKILDNKKEAERLAQRMKHVEAVLKMLDPAYNVRAIAIRRRKPNPYFKRGTIFRSVLDALREAGRPLTVRGQKRHGCLAQGRTEPIWRGTSGSAESGSVRAQETAPERWIVCD
jgi:hypothetical protein